MKEMKTQPSPPSIEQQEEEDHHSWWRSSTVFNQSLNLKLHRLNISTLTPTISVLRELERLALVAPQGLTDLRRKLLTYRPGDFWLPIGGINKEDLDIPPIVTILLVGFSGSGKSSLLNLMYSLFGRSGLIPFAQTSLGMSSSNYSDATAMVMEEHNVMRSVKSRFCVFDSKGFGYEQKGEVLEQLSSWMSDGVHHNQLCSRFVNNDGMEIDFMKRSSPLNFARRRVNCVMMVVNTEEVYEASEAGDLNPLEAVKEVFCSPVLRRGNEKPILILTHGDTLPAEERIKRRINVCEILGISESRGVYDVVCLTEYGFVAEESDPVSAYALTEALYRALIMSDKSHLPKRKPLDWVALVLSWLIRFFATLFAFLADVCSKFEQRKFKY